MLAHDAFYDELKRRGFTFGPRFEGLESIQLGDGEAVGFVRLPEAFPLELTGRVHPALFDAGLQVLIAAVESRRKPGERSPGFLPTHADKIASYAPIGSAFWSHATLSESTTDGFAGSVAIFDESGACLLEIEGLRARTLESVHGDQGERRGRRRYLRAALGRAPARRKRACRRRELVRPLVHRSARVGRRGSAER